MPTNSSRLWSAGLAGLALAAVTAAPAAALGFHNAGGGAFSTGIGPSAIASADVDGDTRKDLLVANYGGKSVQVLRGDGLGGFTALGTEIDVAGAGDLVIGDLNADGKLDFVALQPVVQLAPGAAQRASVRLGAGDGTFTAAPDVTGLAPAGEAAANLVVADVDKDGKLDLATSTAGTAVGGNGPGGIAVLKGNGDGTFAAGAFTPSNAGTQTPVSIVSADFDGDTFPDLATGNANPNLGSGTTGTISVYRNDGAGAFALNPATTIAVAPVAGAATNGRIIAADFNGDGRADLLSANYWVKTLGVALNDGSGNFPAAATTSAIPNGAGGASCAPMGVPAAGDVNGDGKLDVVVNNGTGKATCVLIGNGAGGFAALTPQAQYRFTATGFTNYSHLTDVNGDGRLDIVNSNPGAGVVVAGVNVLLNAEYGITGDADAYAVQPVSTMTPTRTFTITNNGASVLGIADVSVTGGEASDFPVVSDGCVRDVPVGGTCRVKIAFSPSAVGSRTSALIVTAAAGAGKLRFPLAATGSAAPTSGTNGIDGAPGTPGASGTDGVKGDPGVSGAPGAKGDAGAAGPVGPKGTDGAKGDTGAVGAAGANGAGGPQGASGATGPKGDAGPAGRDAKATCAVQRVKGRQTVTCKVKAVKGGATKARLTRHGRTYASGTAGALRARRAIVRGTYTLRLAGGVTQRVAIR